MPERIRQRITVSLLILVWSVLSVSAQGVGSTEQEVLKNYGAPQIERAQSGGKKLWIYSNGTRLVFANGVVVESNVSASPPAPQPKTAPSYTPPPPRPVVQEKPKSQPAKTQSPTRPTSRSPLSDMSGLALVIVGIGVITGTVGGIWLLIISFRTSILWGLGCIFVPFVSLLFVIIHWREAKGAFALNAGGALIVIFGVVVGASYA
jgi:hypothetical protein